ncbi:MAG: HAD-IIIC family phosphatase [Treponema sp.]|nr:HAD-IIIC family phosphatase [Treponema sp.]
MELISFKSDFLEDYLPKISKKVKCVVWDLDGTLWDGILAEDGIQGIKLKENIVDIIKQLDSKGIINSICSKNYEVKAIEVLKQFGIYEYFVCPAINWNSKSQNIKHIAKTLDIGLDTFVFVDDSFFELNEVKINCPVVRTCDVKDFENFVKRDFFDVPVTEDSKNRRKSYQEIAIRNKDATQFDDITEFLKSCNMTAFVHAPNDEELLRCYELIQRTNQLNISAERLTLDEIKHFISSKDYDCYRIKVKDKYGDYGLVGFAIFDKRDKESLILKHFVFSCRAARKKIEQCFFEYIINKYEGKGFNYLILTCKRTEKNQLMQNVLEESGLFEKKELSDGAFLLTHNMEDKVIPQNILTIKEE